MENVIEEVQQEVVQAAKEVVQAAAAEAVKVEEEVKETVRAIQEITTEEKLAIRNIENEFLKAAAEIQRLTGITNELRKSFTEKVEKLAQQYVLTPAEYVFDSVTLTFKKR